MKPARRRVVGVQFVGLPLRGQDGNIRGFAIVDLVDLPVLSGRAWHLTTQGYPRSNRPGGGFDYLHRFLCGLGDGDRLEVDHINLNKLDNRRSNLRVVTQAQNAQNLPPIGKSRLRGVGWDEKRGKWRAAVKVAGAVYDFGLFTSEEEAGATAAEGRRRLMPFSKEALDG